MKKLNLILIMLIVITIILIVVKIHNQEVIENLEFETGISKENLEYEVKREILYGEKSKYSKFNSEGQRINNSDALKKTPIVDNNFEVTDFNLVYQNGYTRINVKVKNTSSETKGGYDVDLVFFNDQDAEVVRLKSYLNEVESNEETIIATSITADIADVYRCEIQNVEEESDE